MAYRRIFLAANYLATSIAALAVTVQVGHAACVPLPDAALGTMDRLAEAYPERGAAAAEAELANLAAGANPLRQAQLYAIIAQARSDEGRSDEAHSAVAASLAKLGEAAATPLGESLRARLVIAAHINAESTADLATAIGALTDELTKFAGPSVERGCLLAARSELYTEQLQLDSAATDATAAYSIATSHSSPQLRAAASVALGTLYRRSGLPVDAQRMYDESLEYFGRIGAESQALTLSYFRAQALNDQGRDAEALAAFQKVRSSSERIGDEMGVAITSLPICDLLIKLDRITDAERECAAGLATFKRFGRTDLETLITAYQAEIDVKLRKPRLALAKYVAVLGAGEHETLPVDLARWYRGRSHAYAALGRLPEALKDLTRADAIEQKHDLDQRARAALAVKAIADAQQQADRARALQERLTAQARDLASRATIHRLAGAVAVLAAVLATILGGFLWLSRRHARVLRRQAAILRSATANAPDALILLDADWRVLYANRNLLGEGTPAAAGTSFLTTLNEPNRTTIERVLRDVESDPAPRTIAVTVAGPDGGARSFEVWVLPVVEGSQVDRVLVRSFDVTELRHLEREVARRSSTERDRLSGDLHEGLCQELSGIAMLVAAVAHSESSNQGEDKKKLADIALQLGRAVKVTADLARGASPVRTTRGMLGPALRRLGTEVCARTGSDIVTRCHPEDRELPPLIADQAYQIARDGLLYAASHAKRIEVELAEASGSFNLTIKFAMPREGITAGTEDSRILPLIAHRAQLIGGLISDVTTDAHERMLTLTVPTSPEGSGNTDQGAVYTARLAPARHTEAF